MLNRFQVFWFALCAAMASGASAQISQQMSSQMSLPTAHQHSLPAERSLNAVGSAGQVPAALPLGNEPLDVRLDVQPTSAAGTGRESALLRRAATAAELTVGPPQRNTLAITMDSAVSMPRPPYARYRSTGIPDDCPPGRTRRENDCRLAELPTLSR